MAITPGGAADWRTVNLIEDLMERSPASRLGIVAVDAEGNRRDWYFGELIACSAGLSGAFAARGVGRGDVVMTLVGNRIEWALTLLACWRMGAVALPCSTQLRPHDLELRAAAANPKLCVGEAELLSGLPAGVPTMTLDEVAEVLDEDRPQETPAAIEEMGAEDPALIVFTSGTTGEPRGVVHAYRYLLGQRTQAEHWLGSRPGELAWCTTAPGWSKSARNVFLAPWLTGAAAVIHDGSFDPAERLDFAEALGVNVLCQAPTEYRMLARRTALRPLPALRRMVSAGEPLDPETIAAFREATGLEPADGYGQTETGQVTANLAGERVRHGSMGKPLPGFETRVVEGELQLRAASSPTFFSRYLDGERFEGEWWPTGDLVRADEDSYLFFEGRDDDLILSSGYRIGPTEVEAALLSHPAVAEAAAVAAPDPERGSVVRAVVVPRDREASEELARELQEHCKRETAPYKSPRIIEFVTELPKTNTGKLKRAQLRAEYPAHMATRPEADPATVARAYFDAVAKRDVEAMAACWEAGSLDVIHGVAELRVPEDLRTWFGGLFAAFPDFRFEVLDVMAAGEKAAVRWRATGTFDGTGDFVGLLPNGRSVDVEGCDVLTVRDGRVVHNDAYMNGAEMVRQLGVLPPLGSRPERAMLAAANLKSRLARRLGR